MKKILLSTLLLFGSVSLFAEGAMSAADKALYSADDNPGEIYLIKGEQYFNKIGGSLGDFSSFLGTTEEKLGEVVASFPKYVEKLQSVVSLEQAIQGYFSLKNVKAPALKSDDMANMTLYIRAEANELPINIDSTDKRVLAYIEKGEELWKMKRGKRGLACYSCHTPDMVGMRLRMQELPDPNDKVSKSAATFPAYRMMQSQIATLQTRMQQCMKNSAQAVIPHGSKEIVALEAYLTSKVKGQEIAVPGLKR